MKIVFFSGAGVSQESGIPTYRDGDNALWKKYNPDVVASVEGWNNDTQKCLDFYNYINKHISDFEPNAAHKAIADLEKYHEVIVITQNVDDLHERGGSSTVVHLHGEIRKMRSSIDSENIMPYINPIKIGQLCSKGSQIRPHVVMFGEMPFNLHTAANYISEADILIVIGTSLQVEPAASLISYVPRTSKVFVIDKDNLCDRIPNIENHIIFYEGSAINKVPELVNNLIEMS